MEPFYFWVIFCLFVIVMLVVDIKVFHRRPHDITIREAILWTLFWVALALCFNVGVYFYAGPQKALEFLTGYLIEKSLSIDNLFVFLMLFTYFGVKSRYQHSTLFWGIIGALIFRAIFIFAGIALIKQFSWVIYVFGAFLVYIGVKMALAHDNVEIDPEHNPVLRFVRRVLPVAKEYEGGKFFLRKGGRLLATPLFVVLIAIETTDIVFAVDSIPAILAISQDPFIVFTSNVFAILGLRALYFALAGLMNLFRFLHYGLAAILVFVGVKMIITFWGIHIPTVIALGVVGMVIALSVVISLIFQKKE